VVLKKKSPINFAAPMKSFLYPIPAICAVLLAFSFTASAQSEDPRADELLGKVSAQMQEYGSVHAKYTSQMVDLQSDFQMDQSGEVWIEGESYHLQLGEYMIVCDGSTVWTYEPEMGECYIDDAETIAEDGVDPAQMFTIWEADFKKVWKGELESEGRTLARVDLHPTGAEERSFHTIQCFIDPAVLQVVELIVKGREGTDVHYKVEAFEGDAPSPEGAFSFDKDRFPGTTMIDNRL
jgi:outer membrane lipoprotein-sorting protein